MIIKKDKPADYGFAKEKIVKQIVIGIIISMVFAVVFIGVPYMTGLGNLMDNGKRYTKIWQFTYEFIYYILAIGLVEEFVFRGFFYEKIRRISNEKIAIIGSSALFGVCHIFGGNFVQVISTMVLGIIWCLCRCKIKNCTMLSLIMGHGIYDWLITVFSSVLG